MGESSVLVTGCSSGIGRCVALGLHARGYRVIATARKADDLRALRDAGLHALELHLDDPHSVAAAAQAALDIGGGHVYGLFNNGAYGQPGAVEDLRWEVLEAQLRTNLLGWHELTRRLIPAMRAHGAGRIIQNSSVLGLVAMPYRGAYNCSKFALEGLTDTLRLELHGSGVHVSLVEPGPIVSRFRENAFAKFREHIDAQGSVHRDNYQAMIARLAHEGPTTRFTLPPEAVLKRVIHALESRRPRARYAVTTPTYVFAFLRRLLSTRQLDALLRRASGGGSR
ncbi:MAG: SDR family oxidoreductase [Chromatiaceae bacterium]|nr:SDR family oxidoreductase [Gammaproteobacteria bacterium]MCP5312997.1 SDR family oxidoreductase [Chromatiaceae bacterium]